MLRYEKIKMEDAMKKIILESKHLCKSFANEGVQSHILNDMNLKLYKGDFTVVMGTSGSGKSTLLYCLSGMDKPTSGQVIYNGENIAEFNEKRMAGLRTKDFGFVFQQINLVGNLTVEENILVPGYLNKGISTTDLKNRTDMLMKKMRIEHTKDRLLKQVSGGEAQRGAIARAIINVTLTSVGIYVPFKLNYIINICMVCAVVMIVVLFVFIKTNKITKITPIEAINGGIKNIHFSSFLKLPITKKCMNISLAYRQFISEKKQYVSAIFVTMILTMFMIMINDTCKWVNNEENIQKMFTVIDYDFRAVYKNDDVKKKAENIIKSYTDYTEYNFFANYLVLNDVQSFCNIIDDPEQYISVYEGRTCLYDNEVLITKYIADKYELSVGDEVSVSIKGRKEMFIISGIYECADDIGNNFAMNFEGYSKFKNDEEIQNYGYTYYKLDNPEIMNSIIKKLSEEFTINKDYFIETENIGMVSEISTISIAINSITVLIYILSMIFVFITVSIVCKKIIIKEERDYGIYKAIGFTSGKIRLQLAIRFTVSALIGSVSGIVLVLLFSDKIFNVIYQNFGIYNYKSSVNCLSVIITVIFMTVTFLLFAYFKSGKVRRVEPGILIGES